MGDVKQGDRKFYDLPTSQTIIRKEVSVTDPQTLSNYINENIIGRDVTFEGPFGRRKVVYCDYIASGKSLKFIEDFITKEVLSHYGNTHTTTSVTSMQTTLYRHESRDVIRNAVNASEHDSVLFIGHGCTGAVHKLVNALESTLEKYRLVTIE
jgi:selenocysteine lyase/cysteine desulfurase